MDIKSQSKPKIAIIIDKEGWAFFNTAEQIKKYLCNFYDIEIILMDVFGDNAVKLILYGTEYDLMFFMWRGIISWLNDDFARYYINKLGFEYEEFIEKYLRKRNIVTAVYDHLFIDSETERTKFILENIKDYTVSSLKLKNIYDKYDKKPSYVIADGVDLELFKMKSATKYDRIEEKTLIIGWTGNSKFTDENDDDLKGLNKIILPAIKELNEEGYNIELEAADRNVKMIPHNEMPDFYNNIDIYVVASRTEGTPNPILEAMACGVPIISTDVGIVPEVFGNKQKEFIIERSKDELKKKIIKIINNKNILKELSQENLKQIQDWSWKNKCEMFKNFFDSNLN